LRDNADGIAAFLKAHGHEVWVVYDGREALATAGRVRPHVILLDLGMPEMSGHDVCQTIRKETWGNDVLIVAITGWGQETDRTRTADAGFDYHMVKPVEFDRLLQIMSRPAQE
jgi:DNA-binding response OmpR family regulator